MIKNILKFLGIMVIIALAWIATILIIGSAFYYVILFVFNAPQVAMIIAVVISLIIGLISLIEILMEVFK
jgi:hypothetical protein